MKTNFTYDGSPKPSLIACPGNNRRRGVAVIIVLAILSITLALSYSMMRTQVTAVQIHNNSTRRGDARQAAVAGISAALRRMHDSDWGGVDVPLSETLSTTTGFDVTFATGDSSLSVGDPDYADWPYRVTITSIGYAADPADAQLKSLHTVQVVVQLTPRQLATQPNNWNVPQAYTVYQWKPDFLDLLDLLTNLNSQFRINFPSRIDGPVRIQGPLDLCAAYPNHSSSRQQYLGDLNQMRLAGRDDYRPFNDTVSLPHELTSSSIRSLLTNQLAVSAPDMAQSTVADWSLPALVSSYRLYPGGQEYTVETVSDTLENVALEADPQTNPLGLFYRFGQIEIRNNVTIHGTLIIDRISGADLRVTGTNVNISAVDLPPLFGTSQPIQLPVVLAADDLQFYSGAAATVSGLVVVEDEFDVKSTNQNSIDVLLAGRVICREMLIEGRNEWEQTGSWYSNRLDDFNAHVAGGGSIEYFPDYLEINHGLVAAPRIHIQPPAAAVSYHWNTSGDPVFQPHADDDGLMWDLVDWRDSP